MRTLLYTLSLIVATGCASSKKQIEHATKYEREGMLLEAFDRYERVHQRKPNNVDAHIGMKRCAQGLFDPMQQAAVSYYLMNDLGSGERSRQEAAAFKRVMDDKGLDLHWDPQLERYRHDAQMAESARLFELANAAFREIRFDEAEDLAGKSLKLDDSRKEAAYLLKISQLEPIYREGQRAMELGLWRNAYRSFRKVTLRDPGYKEAWDLEVQAREHAQVVLTYVPIPNKGLIAGNIGIGPQGVLEEHLAAALKEAILDLHEPLIVLVDKEDTDHVLDEQQRQLSGVYDDRYVVDAGKLISARYVLTSKILRYDEVFRREIEVQMQLLDTQSGRIQLSEIIAVNKEELARGNTRTQLFDRSAKRMASRLAEFDPSKR